MNRKRRLLLRKINLANKLISQFLGKHVQTLFSYFFESTLYIIDILIKVKVNRDNTKINDKPNY